MLEQNHKPKNGWTLMIVDMDLIDQETWKKLPWSMVSNLTTYGHLEPQEFDELCKEIKEYTKA